MRVEFINGSVPVVERSSVIRRMFPEEDTGGGKRVLLVHFRAGSEGLNIQNCHRI